MNVLALNCGSSSLKFRLLAVEPGEAAADSSALAGGRVERLGDDARLTLEHDGRTDEAHAPVHDHAIAVDRVLAWLADLDADVEAVGHRVVHGGARFTTPTRIDADVVRAIEALEVLAPLHNRPALAGIRA
jgi:acetate kinase